MRPTMVLLAALLCLPTALQAAQTVEKDADGAVTARYGVNAAGKRDGAFTAFHAGGKVVAEKSQYHNGVLHGTRTLYDAAGTLAAEEMWLEGRLVFPKSQRFIEAMRKQIPLRAQAAVAALAPLAVDGAPPPEGLAQALARIRLFRFLCDVPYDDIVFAPEYTDCCQHASQLLAQIKHLDHKPAKPDGMDESFYRIAYRGTSESNLSQGRDLPGSIDGYMDDSDASNIDRLGHRRWVLNPSMLRTGMGITGQFSALYSFDHAREEVADYDVICYPPRGYCPADCFGERYAWHASFNPAHWQVGAGSRLTIRPVGPNLKPIGDVLELDYEHVDLQGFGIPNAVIARPKPSAKGVVVKKGATYEVTVSGLTPVGDRPTTVSYVVSFY